MTTPPAPNPFGTAKPEAVRANRPAPPALNFNTSLRVRRTLSGALILLPLTEIGGLEAVLLQRIRERWRLRVRFVNVCAFRENTARTHTWLDLLPRDGDARS